MARVHLLKNIVHPYKYFMRNLPKQSPSSHNYWILLHSCKYENRKESETQKRPSICLPIYGNKLFWMKYNILSCNLCSIFATITVTVGWIRFVCVFCDSSFIHYYCYITYYVVSHAYSFHRSLPNKCRRNHLLLSASSFFCHVIVCIRTFICASTQTQSGKIRNHIIQHEESFAQKVNDKKVWHGMAWHPTNFISTEFAIWIRCMVHIVECQSKL